MVAILVLRGLRARYSGRGLSAALRGLVKAVGRMVWERDEEEYK